MQSETHSTKPSQAQHYVHWFRHSAPYINTHRHKTFVIMFAGEAVQHPNFQHIIHDIALLHSLGIRLILVYGARPQINQNLKDKNIPAPYSIETPAAEINALFGQALSSSLCWLIGVKM